MQDHQERRRTLSHPIGSPKDFETGRDDRLMHRSDSPGKRDLSNSHAHQSPGWPNPEPSQGMKLCVVCSFDLYDVDPMSISCNRFVIKDPSIRMERNITLLVAGLVLQHYVNPVVDKIRCVS